MRLGELVMEDGTPVRRFGGIKIHLQPFKKKRKKNGSKRPLYCTVIAMSASK